MTEAFECCRRQGFKLLIVGDIGLDNQRFLSERLDMFRDGKQIYVCSGCQYSGGASASKTQDNGPTNASACPGHEGDASDEGEITVNHFVAFTTMGRYYPTAPLQARNFTPHEKGGGYGVRVRDL